MPFICSFPRSKTWIALLSLSAVSLGAQADAVDLGTVGGSSGAGAADTPSVSAEEGTASSVAPSQANLSATQPQSFISRAYIENSTPATGNFNSISGIAPSVASMPSTNGPGMSDQKATMRGFQDGEYNVTFDGIPFGDTNGPTHHSTAYFPASVIGGMVIERGPGNASNIGYSTYGGSINLFSKTPSEQQGVSVYGSYGRWQTWLGGVSYESGRMKNDDTLQLNLQYVSTNGYLTESGQTNQNITAKYQRPVGDGLLLTAFATLSAVKTYGTDNASGPTAAQVAALGQSYVMNNNPNSQGFRGFNVMDKSTDLDYLRLQGRLAQGWEFDNNAYTYAYTNRTIAGQDPSQFNGAGDATLGFNDLNKKPVMLPNGDVPGYDKLNMYRVWGDVFKATRKFDAGLLRVGAWYEGSSTNRHNYEMNLTTGQMLPGATPAYPDGVVTSSNFARQTSRWNQIQPFAEFEWALAPGLTVTPGYKAMYYRFALNSAMNQKALVAQSYKYTYKAGLPFLTANLKLGEHDSTYVQYAKGMQVPFLGVGSDTASPPDPQYTTNYQIGYVHKSDDLTLSADVYYININNLQLNTGTNANPDYINAGGAVYKGVELEGTYALTRGWAVYGNYTINSARYKSGNAAVGQPTGEAPNAPNMTSALGLLLNQGPWNASLIFKRIGQQYNSKLGGQLPRIDNVDLNVAYTFRNLGSRWAKALRVQASVFNLTNRRGITSVTGPLDSAATQYQWQAPRSVMLSAKLDF
jgi:iron complex outermembrane receptor protein